MKQIKRKPKKDSLIALTKKYANNHQECVKFFFNMKWKDGFYCEKCHCTHYHFIKRGNVIQCANPNCKHQHYLLADTIFQDNKLDLYKLILGIFLFFTANKGISGVDLASELDVNYKTALLLMRKCRILMAQSNKEKILDSLFYEADTIYIGGKSKESGHQGCSTEQQPFLIMLSTDKENEYPRYIKLHPMKRDEGNMIASIIGKSMKLGKERKLNTDGKTTFQPLKDKINLNSEKIIYTEQNHRLKWLNIIVGNIQNNIVGIYHGVSKRELPLFINEQQWRFNHRYTGKNIINKASEYIFHSTPMPRKMISKVLDLALPYYAS